MNMTVDYTIVCGVDAKHLRQLAWTWPTWSYKKPSLLKHPMLIFFDYSQVQEQDVRKAVNHPDLTVVPWPPVCVTYKRLVEGKFGDPQRYKMLAGFVYVPATYVKTEYWLKLDTDTVATGQDDWIDDKWFENNPAIVAQPWSFTKPPDQMMLLDKWANGIPLFNSTSPLNLVPKEGASRVGHKRIISWCGFFSTSFSNYCAMLLKGDGYQLPVPSQDGFMFYVAKRLGRVIVRKHMKGLGWEHWGTEWNICQAVEKVLGKCDG